MWSRMCVGRLIIEELEIGDFTQASCPRLGAGRPQYSRRDGSGTNGVNDLKCIEWRLYVLLQLKGGRCKNRKTGRVRGRNATRSVFRLVQRGFFLGLVCGFAARSMALRCSRICCNFRRRRCSLGFS